MDLNTPLWQLTVGEFIELSKKVVVRPTSPADQSGDKRYVYGITGIAKLFDCSKRSASRLKASGKIDRAILQDGRKIVVDVDKALELFGKNK